MVGLESKIVRAIKRADEISKIKRAVRYTEKAMEHGLSFFERGMSELTLNKEIRKWAADRGLKVAFCLIQGDKNSASIHGKPTKHKIKDVLLMDVGLVYKRYHGDVSRTYLFTSNNRMKNVYSIVKNAHELAISKIKLGIECKELDRVVREKITNSGYKFRHSTGHGIGLRIHEFPKIGPKSNHILQKNMAFTIEPGIYLKNEFGVRIEDCFVMKNRALKISKLEIPTYD